VKAHISRSASSRHLAALHHLFCPRVREGPQTAANPLPAAGAAALPAVSRIAWAQAYPTRPVRMIVPFPAGGSTDVLARLMGQWLSVRLAQPFLVENRTAMVRHREDRWGSFMSRKSSPITMLACSKKGRP
jgi:hypothetical protein